MLKSMTGYGKSVGEVAGKAFQIEVRSINSKTLDLTCRLSHEFRELEPAFRTRIGAVLSRGKVECCLNLLREEAASDSVNWHVNSLQAASYLKELRELEPLWREAGRGDVDELCAPKVVLMLPGVVTDSRVTRLSEEAMATVMRVLDEALQAADASRSQEGAVLEKDLCARAGLIDQLGYEVEPFEAGRVPAIRQKLEKQLADWETAQKSVDRNRLEQEMIYYLEKLDITEEKVRLHKHCAYFIETMKEEMPGRKLAFIAQEMGREINTMGSKANEVDIQKLVVRMKDELEKIKEQLFNIL